MVIPVRTRKHGSSAASIYNDKSRSMFNVGVPVFLMLVLMNFNSGAQGTWTPLTHAAPHYNAGEMELMTDGTVLCKTSSGGSGQGTVWDKLTPDVHGSYINGTWSSVAAMHYDRLYFSTQVLTDGRLYVAGGEYGAGGTQGEVYNPLTNTWTMTPQIVTANNISDANSELLPDGTVLQAIVDTGGTKLNRIYYPATNTYSLTASCLRGDNEAPWIKLPDNTSLFLDNYSTTSERYSPPTHTWINDGTLPGSSLFDPYGEEAGAGFLMPNGKVWFIGSTPLSAYYTPSGTTSPGTWTDGPAIPNNQGAPDACAAMMTNGVVLLCLSPTPTSGEHFPDSTTFYTFDYTTNTYTMVAAPGSTSDTLDIPTYYTNMLCLPDGTILYSAQGDDQYYEFTPASAPLSAGQPTISNIIRTSCDTFEITGTLFNGITEGACYGDDWQMETNYPIVQLSSGTNVYYARSMKWNRPGAVMTGAALDTATFVLPTGLAYGTYTVKVIVNGNPSAPSSVNTNPVAITPSNGVVCVGAQTTFTEPLTGGTWSSAVSGIATIGSTGVATGVAAGLTNITYTNQTCVSLATVSVNLTPAAIGPAGPTSVCTGSTVDLTDMTGTGTWSNDASGNAVVGGTGIVSGVTAGTAVISYTLPNNCYVTDTVTVNPTPFGISGTLATCTGSTTNLTDPTGSGTWSSNNIIVATIDPSSGVASGEATGTSVITYTVPTGCYTTAVLQVFTAPSPIGGTPTVCAGATTSLTDGVGGGNWASASTGIATVGATTGNVTGVTNGTTTITYTVAGCTTTSVVTVNLSPTTISGASTVCASYTTNLTDGVGSGTWTSSNIAAATVTPGTGVVSGVATGSTIITYTISDGCYTSMPMAVSFTPAAITGATSLCDGASALLHDVDGGGTWSTAATDITIGSSTGIVTGETFGTATVSYTLGGSCYTTAEITINESPGPISGNTTLCMGIGTSLSDPALGGVWSSGSTGVATVDASGNVSGVSAGTAEITYNLGGLCYTNTIVTVNNIPTAISGSTTLCASGTASLGDGVTGGTWSSSNNLVATVGVTNGVVTGEETGTAVITYTMGANCDVTTPVTLIASPAAIGGTTTVCLSGTATLTNSVSGGTWTSSNTAVATIEGTLGSATGISLGTSIITYTIGTGCFVTTVFNVTPPTSAPVTGSTTVCAGQTAPLADATLGGAWSSTNLAIATINSSGVVTGVTPGVVTVSYTVSTACGTAYATQVMTVNAAPTVAAVTGTASVCTGATTSLSDATASGVWSSGNTVIATVGSLTGVVSGINAGVANISYTVTNIAGCSATAQVSVTVTNPLPAIITPTGPLNFCTGGSVTLDATAGSGLNYQWMFDGVDISGASSSSFTTTTPGDYTVSVNSGHGCISISGQVTVTVNTSAHMEAPTVSISALPGTILCLTTAPVTFTASSYYGGTPVYQWFVNGTSMASGTTYTYSPANGDVVECLLTSNYVCASPSTATTSTTMTISPNETPGVSISANPGTTSCPGETVLLTAVPLFGGTTPSYLWTKNGVNVGTGPTYSLEPADGDIVKCELTSDYPCLATNTATSSPVTLHVNPPYTNTVNISVTQSSIAIGQTDTFSVTSTHGGSSPHYQWYVNGMTVPGATRSTYVTDSLQNGQIVSCEVISSDPCASPNETMSGGIRMLVGVEGVATINGNSGFLLEPNPNKGVFTISGSVSNTAQNVTILVSDMLGQNVYKESFLPGSTRISHQVQLPNALANGSYIVAVTSGSDRLIFHIVIDK